MGITRRHRHNPLSADKENDAKHNRESRPWDNQASLRKLPKLSAPQPIRPPPLLRPSDERFVPLLRAAELNLPASTKAAPAPMSVLPRRKADHLSASAPFTPVAAAAFQADPTAKRERPTLHAQAVSPKGLSVSDRMRIFEKLDESLRERAPAHVLRKSPFKGALEAFGGTAPDAPSSSSSSERDLPFSPPPRQPPELKTRIGNREVQPMLSNPTPPPFIGLPIPNVTNKHHPQKVHQAVRTIREKDNDRDSCRAPKAPRLDLADRHPLTSDPDQSIRNEEGAELEVPPSEDKICVHPDLAENHGPAGSGLDSSSNSGTSLSDSAGLPEVSKLDQPMGPGTSKMSLEDPDLMPRFSYRHSVRLPKAPLATSTGNLSNPPRSSFRHSRRLASEDTSQFSFLPKSSSFLDFDEDERLSPLEDEDPGEEKSEATSKGPSQWTDMSFDEPDSFDTFATLPKELKSGKDLEPTTQDQTGDDFPRPGSNESEKPTFPVMSFSKKGTAQRGAEEEDDGALDVPNRFTRRPGTEGALRDLQRASVTAGNEIAASLRRMRNGHEHNQQAMTKEEKVSRVQGDILLRSRIFRRWNLRYASIVHQGYFGAVLLLFQSDSKGGSGATFALRRSKMIALTESTVRKVDNARKAGSMYMFELKTSQRAYMFACNDEEGRDFWMNNLSSSGA